VGKAVTVAVSAFFKEFLNMGEIDVLHHVPFIALGRQADLLYTSKGANEKHAIHRIFSTGRS
jgi:hypothetical protein